MLALVLRGFLQRKLRVLLTAIAIALGVALMAGTYILTDTINHSFAGIFQTANKGDAVVISPAERSGAKSARKPRRSPTRCSRACARSRASRRPPARSSARPRSSTPHGKRLTTTGAPAFVASDEPGRFKSFSPVQGRFAAERRARSRSTKATAERKRLKLGEQLVVAGDARPLKRYTIVGIVKFAGSQSFGGAGTALLTLAEAQRIVGDRGASTRSTSPPRPA